MKLKQTLSEFRRTSSVRPYVEFDMTASGTGSSRCWVTRVADVSGGHESRRTWSRKPSVQDIFSHFQHFVRERPGGPPAYLGIDFGKDIASLTDLVNQRGVGVVFRSPGPGAIFRASSRSRLP